MASNDFEIERHCSINKKPGIAQLSSTHLVWTPDSAAYGSELRVPLTSIRSFQVTKESTSKKALIRLTLSDRSDKPTLDFQKCFTDRDAFRDMLSRLQSPTTAADSPNSAAALSQTTTATQAQATPTQQRERVEPLAPEELERRRLLFQRKEVISLHRTVVEGGAASDDTFWAAMRYRYKDTGEPRGRGGLSQDDDPMDIDGSPDAGGANGADGATANGTDAQVASLLRHGVPSEAFVATGIGSAAGADGGANGGGASSNSGGGDGGAGGAMAPWTSVVPTAAQRHLVFMNRPAVVRAHRQLVGTQSMAELQFWTYFGASSVGQRMTGKVKAVVDRKRRSKTDTARTAEADGVFAPFETAERRMAAAEVVERAQGLARELDLGRRDEHRGAHVSQTHGGDSADSEVHTGLMGRETSSGLRLMRQVNRHGGLVLEEGGVGAWRTEGVDTLRPLDDLVQPEERPLARLGMQGVAEFAAVTAAGGVPGVSGVGFEACRRVRDAIAGWEPDVRRFRSAIAGGPQQLDQLLSTMRP